MFTKTYSASLLFSLVLMFLVALSGCATVSADRVDRIWAQVRSEYPDCNAEKPKVIWVDEPIYLFWNGEKVWCYGVYMKETNTVLLEKDWAGEGTVRHEFRHACGDSLGQKPGKFVDATKFSYAWAKTD